MDDETKATIIANSKFVALSEYYFAFIGAVYGVFFLVDGSYIVAVVFLVMSYLFNVVASKSWQFYKKVKEELGEE